jgi:hypothetical protein
LCLAFIDCVYLFLKFVTLTGEGERQRLIPVLKTMLKLTTEEVDRLEVIVKGDLSVLMSSYVMKNALK